MTFLSRLLAPIHGTPEETPVVVEKPVGTRTARVQAEYAKLFATPTTVAKAAAEYGVDHVTMLNQIYRYEKKGWMGRGEHPENSPGRPLLFIWKGPQ